eukprot:m.88185 g.88185  ORF g.88185 m.88185 type:complete len:793 (-) comp16429_c0_seq10:3185-5563(-)
MSSSENRGDASVRLASSYPMAASVGPEQRISPSAFAILSVGEEQDVPTENGHMSACVCPVLNLLILCFEDFLLQLVSPLKIGVPDPDILTTLSDDDTTIGSMSTRAVRGLRTLSDGQLACAKQHGSSMPANTAMKEKHDGVDLRINAQNKPENENTIDLDDDDVDDENEVSGVRQGVIPIGHCDITHSTDATHIDMTQWGKWVTGIAVVGFDLELGQSLEKLFPLGTRLEEEDAKNVRFLSFPDSNSGCTGDIQFYFRIRASTVSLPRFSKVHKKRYLCGTVYFRQVPDTSLKRGFYQKSVVLLTEQPFPRLHRRICGIVAREYFSRGDIAIQAACTDIHAWPAPVPGTRMELPLLGRKLAVDVPSEATSIRCTAAGYSPDRSNRATTDGQPQQKMSLLAASPFDFSMYDTLHTVLPHIQLLWELMLTAEPMIVRTTNPMMSSHVVLALVCLIAPLQYMGDYRPYFTIQDTDCAVYVRQKKRYPCAVLGVTNPYFDLALDSWPTLLSFRDTSPSPRTYLLQRSGTLAANVHGRSSGDGALAPAAAGSSPHRVRSVRSPAPRADRTHSGGGSNRNVHARPVLKTSTKQLIEHDKHFIREILNITQRDQANALMRAHFWSQTQQFMIPLESHLARLMPLKRSMSPYSAVPTLAPFVAQDFLATLPTSGPPPPIRARKGNWVALYTRFLSSPTFRGWLDRKRKSANEELQRQYLKRMCAVDLRAWAAGKAEVEVMNLFLKIKDCLEEASRRGDLTAQAQRACHDQLMTLKAVLPPDVRESLAMSPVRHTHRREAR